MTGKIFINYRRDDSISTAGRLHDRLAQTFGRKNLFMDVDHIPAGVDFVAYLNSQLAACDIFLAIIGPNWLNAKDDFNRRRLDNSDDFVAVEIATALARNIRVIPVLVDGAHMPKADQLPDSVKPLVRRNALEIRNAHFGRNAEELVDKVREALQGGRPVRRRPLASVAATVAGSATALLLMGWIGLYQRGVPLWVPWTPRVEQPAEPEARHTEAEQQRLKEEIQRQERPIAISDLPDRVIAAMERKGYRVDRGPGEVNIVYVEGMDPDSTPHANEADKWNDLRLVIRFEGGKPKIVGSWAGTTGPGRYWTENPMDPAGAARIEFGQYQAWKVGEYYGQEALIQTGAVMISRDQNKDGLRTGDQLYTGNFGLHQHGGYDLPEIRRTGAGALIGQSMKGHRDFMAIVKSDPRYQADHDYVFATTILRAFDVLAVNNLDDSESLFKEMAIDRNRLAEINQSVDRIVASKTRYEAVQTVTGVPWFVVGIIHRRETAGDFSSHLNGDPLSARTVHVPAGRPAVGNPPFAWQDSAIDLLKISLGENRNFSTIGDILYTLELWNVFGYRRRNVPFPYIWNCTNQYSSGKYSAVDASGCGAAALLKVMLDRNDIHI